MKTSHKIYSIVAVAVGVGALVRCAHVALDVVPFYWPDPLCLNHSLVALVLGLAGATITIVSVVNLARSELVTVPTILQLLLLFVLFPYGTPIAAWGVWLVYPQARTQDNDDLGESGESVSDLSAQGGSALGMKKLNYQNSESNPQGRSQKSE